MAALTVLCPDTETPDGGPYQVSRATCLAFSRVGCAICPAKDFSLTLQYRIPEQIVACPRWELESDRLDGMDPLRYESVSRLVCLSEQPYPECDRCPNAKSWEPPRSDPGWLERQRSSRLRE